MSKHRTPQQKLEIIHEARAGGLPISQVCRKHGITPSNFYLWEKRFKDAGLDALKRPETKLAAERVEELEAQVARLKDVIAEIAEENIKLKKGRWP